MKNCSRKKDYRIAMRKDATVALLRRCVKHRFLEKSDRIAENCN